MRLRRNYSVIYQDLADQLISLASPAVKRFVAPLVRREPEQFDQLEFAPAEEAQRDYDEGALTRVSGSDGYRDSSQSCEFRE